MSFLDCLRPHVVCTTCNTSVLTRDAVLIMEHWAGEHYECKVCDMVRKLEGRPSWFDEHVAPALNRPRNMMY